MEIVRGRDKKLVLRCTYTDAEIRQDFEAFTQLKESDMVEENIAWVARTGCPIPSSRHLYRLGRIGQKLSLKFHWQHRAATGSMWQYSANHKIRQFNKDPETLKTSLDRLRPHSGDMSEDQLLWLAVRTNSTWMTVTHFRVTVSKHLSDVMKARDVLDFSAGWGDRLTGFLASPSVEHITLIDPRPGSISGCRKQHEFVRSTKKLRLIQKGAEDALPVLAREKKRYDLILSSPPYFNLELYGEDERESKGQIRNKVSNAKEYLQVFLFPVLSHAADLLRPGGILAINVDDNARADVILCKPTLQHLRRRNDLVFLGTAGLRKQKGFGKGDVGANTNAKAEPIYMFQKR